jgi:hypothetical protein
MGGKDCQTDVPRGKGATGYAASPFSQALTIAKARPVLEVGCVF